MSKRLQFLFLAFFGVTLNNAITMPTKNITKEEAKTACEFFIKNLTDLRKKI